MRNLKKVILVLSITACMAVFAAGCGNSSGQSETTTAAVNSSEQSENESKRAAYRAEQQSIAESKAAAQQATTAEAAK